MGILEPHIKSRRLKAFGGDHPATIGFGSRIAHFVGIGLPGYVSVNTKAAFAPAKTLAPIVNRLSREIVPVQNQRRSREELAAWA